MANSALIQKRMQAETIKRFAENTIGHRNFKWQAVLYLALLLLVGKWFPEGIEDYLFYLKGDRSLWTINWKLLCSGLILFAFYWAIKNIVSQSKIHVTADSPAPIKVLCVFLSPFKTRPNNPNGSYHEIIELQNALHTNDLDQLKLTETTWKMPLKAIEHHGARLKQVRIFTSCGENGSSSQFEVFRSLVNYLYPTVQVKEEFSGGLDFLDIRAIFDAVDKLYVEAVEEGYRENDVLVDVTGGLKTNSIAASVATLAKGRQFQYINEDKIVKSYDVTYFDE